MYEKHLLETITTPKFETLGSRCELWPRLTRNTGGNRDRQGNYISGKTARYST